ncbi:putative aldouronate transport system permease protein [Gracilibacillus ureilyticus]|uniref:Putative aldouronate transport system permease protein n=1 Tax=Gracilibacillus ureilyticus TaxID=531814 RepID=A0A1H9VX25_9BACI|nr:carbohydrate ABC transporter permease [Gracilibacillus ureilyticus]SES26172.1 putative aldouronate transport system permease protein [Gracilibacillus ureilyticus]
MRTRRKKSREDYFMDVFNYFLLSIITLVTLYPFYFVLVASFNDGIDTANGGLYLWPREFTLDNYKYFLQEAKWTVALGVTTLRTVVGTFLGVLFTSLVAYGLSKSDLIFRKFYFILVVIAMNVSGGLIAYYVVLNGIGLINSFGVYVIPTMLNLFFLLIAVSFFREIPAELGESARMDGASELTIFLKIILPISLPLLATMTLFIGASQWNSWVDSAYFVQFDHLRTVSYRMMEVINQTMLPTDSQTAQYTAQLQVTQFSVQMTALVISVFPIICVYPFLQKYFVKGMMLGSVKG